MLLLLALSFVLFVGLSARLSWSVGLVPLVVHGGEQKNSSNPNMWLRQKRGARDGRVWLC